MLQKSTLQLLRFKFSLFLMPVYWFALSFIDTVNWTNAIIICIILHIIIYPSSNGYNSYMDMDEESIGGIKNPLKPTKQLFYATLILDIMGVLLSFLISLPFVVIMLLYIIFSRLYSYRGVRLKQYPIVGYLTVITNQGALVFIAIFMGAGLESSDALPWIAVIASSFLIGGFYPITQIYQHKQDRQDGVTTISMLLGIRGTFYFCAFMYLVAFVLLFVSYNFVSNELNFFIILQLFFLPVIVYFIIWFLKVYKKETEANFQNTMKMNWIASIFTNLAFITITIIKLF